MKRPAATKITASRETSSRAWAGFTLIEMVITVAISLILAAVAIPVLSQAMTNMRINSAISGFSAALASSRYKAIRDSQPYTFVVTAGPNTYVLTNTVTNAAANPVPLSSYVSINGGSGAYTYTLCPNGMVYGSGGCPSANQPPALSFVLQNRQINIAVSGTGNVSTTIIH